LTKASGDQGVTRRTIKLSKESRLGEFLLVVLIFKLYKIVMYQGFGIAFSVFIKFLFGFLEFSRNRLAVTSDPPGNTSFKSTFLGFSSWIGDANWEANFGWSGFSCVLRDVVVMIYMHEYEFHGVFDCGQYLYVEW